jgi:tetratricopeptide (TPR) repeat protein
MKFACLVPVLVLCFICSCATNGTVPETVPEAIPAAGTLPAENTEGQPGPRTAEEFFISGAWFSDMGDNDNAINDFTNAIRLNPDFEAAYAYRALAYRSKGDHDRAIADFTHVIRINPHDAIGYFSRGMLYNDKGDYNRAIEDFNRALQFDPEYAAEIYYGRGIAYSMKGDRTRAAADWEAALRINPNHSNARRSLESQ